MSSLRQKIAEPKFLDTGHWGDWTLAIEHWTSDTFEGQIGYINYEFQ
jgi:hypothetical protein